MRLLDCTSIEIEPLVKLGHHFESLFLQGNSRSSKPSLMSFLELCGSREVLNGSQL